jgi:hypothetical protein
MPAIQTTYNEQIPIGYPGQVADMAQPNSITRLVEDVAGIGFGLAVFQGVNDRGITATPGTLFQGVTIADKVLVPINGGAVDTYLQRASAGLLQKGAIFVTVGANVTAGAAAYVTSVGVWTSTATNNTAIPNAYFEKTAASGSVSLVRLR